MSALEVRRRANGQHLHLHVDVRHATPAALALGRTRMLAVVEVRAAPARRGSSAWLVAAPFLRRCAVSTLQQKDWVIWAL